MSDGIERVFVFGDMKKGFPDHDFLKNECSAIYLGSTVFRGGSLFLSNTIRVDGKVKGTPRMSNNSGLVTGEIYGVPDDLMCSVDAMIGGTRKQVMVDGKPGVAHFSEPEDWGEKGESELIGDTYKPEHCYGPVEV